MVVGVQLVRILFVPYLRGDGGFFPAVKNRSTPPTALQPYSPTALLKTLAKVMANHKANWHNDCETLFSPSILISIPNQHSQESLQMANSRACAMTTSRLLSHRWSSCLVDFADPSNDTSTKCTTSIASPMRVQVSNFYETAKKPESLLDCQIFCALWQEGPTIPT